MAEFIAQSEPIVPPSIPQVTQPSVKIDPALYISNESNTLQAFLLGCIALVMSLYLPNVLESDSIKWLGIALSVAAICTFVFGLYSFKRNVDAMNQNEQEYIDWKKSSMLMYVIGGALSITACMVLYETYWTVSSSKPDVSDTISVASFKSVKSKTPSFKSIKSAKSGGSMSSIGF